MSPALPTMPENTVPTDLPDLSSLPLFVRVVAYAVFGGGIGVVMLNAVMGYLRGKNSTPADRTDSAQLAMVTLDSSAIREHTAAMKEVGAQLGQLTAVGQRYLTSLEERQEEDELRAAEQRGYDQGWRNARVARRSKPVGAK